jgi:ABC-type Co2+ transport system permease subunit
MMSLIAIFLFTVSIGTVIWRRNSQKQRKRERGWALFILAIGTVLIMAMQLHVPLPTPVDWMIVLFSPVYKPIIRWIEEDS